MTRTTRTRSSARPAGPGAGIVGLTLAIAAAGVALFAGGVRWLRPLHPPVGVPWWAVAALTAAAEFSVIRFARFRQDARGFTLGEVALTAGLFLASPDGLVLGRLLGVTVADTLQQRGHSLLKLVFNVVKLFLETVVALLVFHAVVRRGDPVGPVGWLAAVLAASLAELLSKLLINAAIMTSGAPRAEQGWWADLGFGALVTLGSTSVALAGVTVFCCTRRPPGCCSYPSPCCCSATGRTPATGRGRTRSRSCTSSPAASRAPTTSTSSPSGCCCTRPSRSRPSGRRWCCCRPGRASRRCAPPSGRARCARSWRRSASRTPRRGPGSAPCPPASTRRPPPGRRPACPAGRGCGTRWRPRWRARAARSACSWSPTAAAAAPSPRASSKRSAPWPTTPASRSRTPGSGATCSGRPGTTRSPTCPTGASSRHLARVSAQAEGVAVLFIDLDGFKAVNDTLGHRAGDQLLAAVAGRLRAVARPIDVVARLAGDEFVIVLGHVQDQHLPTQVAERVLAGLAQPFALDDGRITVGASVGVAIGSSGDGDGDLLRSADAAVYRAKAAGGRGVTVAG